MVARRTPVLNLRSSVAVLLLAAGMTGCHPGAASVSEIPSSEASGPPGQTASPPLASSKPAPTPGPTASPPPAWSKLTPTPLVTAPFSGVGNQFLFAAAPYGDGFVAVGEDLRFDGPVNGAVWTSPNGVDWARLGVAENDLADAEVDLVATDGMRLVAIGGARAGDRVGEGLDRMVWVSDDSVSWHRVSDGKQLFDGVFIRGVAGGPAGFVAWGAEGTRAVVFHSDDGTTWQRTANNAALLAAEVSAVTAYRGGFVAIGMHRPEPAAGSVLIVGGPDTSTAAAWWSPDGRSWSASDIDAGSGLHTLEVGATGLLALGGSGCGGCIGPGIVWRSDDGRKWRRVGADALVSPSYASDGARIIRYDRRHAGEVSSTADGTTWQRVADLGDIGYDGFVVGRHGILFLESIQKGGSRDEVDGGVLYVAAE